MGKTGCKVICGAPTTLAVKGLMMMMMMMMGLMFSVMNTSSECIHKAACLSKELHFCPS